MHAQVTNQSGKQYKEFEIDWSILETKMFRPK